MQHIERYLLSCSDLAAFCQHNGRIRTETLDYEILEQNDHYILVFVQFEEILMAGSGRIAGRIPHQGHLRLALDRYGEVEQVELL